MSLKTKDVDQMDFYNKMQQPEYTNMTLELFGTYVDVYFPHYKSIPKEDIEKKHIRMAAMLAAFSPVRILNGGKRILFIYGKYDEGGKINIDDTYVKTITQSGVQPGALDSVVILTPSDFYFYDVKSYDLKEYEYVLHYMIGDSETDRDSNKIQSALKYLFQSIMQSTTTPPGFILGSTREPITLKEKGKYKVSNVTYLTYLTYLCAQTVVKKYTNELISTRKTSFFDVMVSTEIPDEFEWLIVHDSSYVKPGTVLTRIKKELS